jgi:hypothetical protein
MPDEIKISRTTKINGNPSIETIQTTKSGEPASPSPLKAHSPRKKLWYFMGLTALVCAIPIIGYLRQSETAKRIEGLAIAFFAIAWGAFLIRHFLLVVLEEDRLEEEEFNKNQALTPPSNPSITKQQTNPATPPSRTGQSQNN